MKKECEYALRYKHAIKKYCYDNGIVFTSIVVNDGKSLHWTFKFRYVKRPFLQYWPSTHLCMRKCGDKFNVEVYELIDVLKNEVKTKKDVKCY